MARANAGLKSDWKVVDGQFSMSFTEQVETESEGIKAKTDGASFTVEVDLNELGYESLTPVGKAGLELGIATRVRNVTGGKDFAEARVATDSVLEAFAAGEWGAERGGSAVPFTSSNPLVEAIARASAGQFTTEQVASRLNEKAEAASISIYSRTFAEADDDQRNELRKAVRKSILAQDYGPAVKAALDQINAEKAAARAAKTGKAATSAVPITL